MCFHNHGHTSPSDLMLFSTLLQIFKALFHFDSRATALLFKDLSKAGVGHRAVELFDWLRKLDESHPLRPLCDVYTYTAMIAQCIYQQASILPFEVFLGYNLQSGCNVHCLYVSLHYLNTPKEINFIVWQALAQLLQKIQ